MAKAAGISVSSVQRIWRAHGLRPHLVHRFKLSNDPQFAAKLKKIVGLYVDPARPCRTARGGRDSIDHPPGGHDDVVSAVAIDLDDARLIDQLCALERRAGVAAINNKYGSFESDNRS
jgi:hypothetical protein